MTSTKKTVLIATVTLVLAGAIAVAIAVPLSNRDTDLDQANSYLDEEPIFDGHNDWAWQLRAHLNNAINGVDLDSDLTKVYNGSHTDIPRLRQGRVGGQFWACYCGCSSSGKDAVRQGMQQMDVIRRMIDSYPDDLAYVTNTQEIEEAQKAGKIASTIGVEGGHMIDNSLATLRMLYKLGARYMTLTHSCDLPWATAWNTDNPTQGLTPFGKEVVKEMNRLGMLVDLAHVSDKTMNDSFDVTRSPVIYSHSSVRFHKCDSLRNVPDPILLRLRDNKGVLMINYYNDYVTCEGSATLSDVADHYDYAKDLIGVDYIGVGGDYDGVSRTPTDLEDVSKYPNLIAELLRRGWSGEDVKKISGGNIKRVLKENERIAAELQKSEKPDETWIDPDLVAGPCRTG